jgi:hypothetical protein
MPATPLTGELTKTDLAVLGRWPDPRALLAAGRGRLLALITKTSHGQQGADRAEQWRAAALAAVELYADHPAVAWSDLAAEVGTEVRVLAAVRAELTTHAAARVEAYRFTDPARLAASLPGLAEVGAPAVTAIVGRAGRFRTPGSSAASPDSHHAPARPVRPTARVNPCPRPVTGCCAPP